MTERAAWIAIAERIASRGLVGVGLCREVTELCIDGGISGSLAGTMRLRIRHHLTALKHAHNQSVILAYWEVEDRDLWVPTSRDVRVLAALFLALDSYDDH